jgi:trk system potassium uptake protein TrkH
MRYRFIFYCIGAILLSCGLVMIIPGLIALFYQEEDLLSSILASILTLLCGGIMFCLGKKGKGEEGITHREGFAIVTGVWLFCCLFGAFPYYLYAHIPLRVSDSSRSLPDCRLDKGIGSEFCSFTDSFFESTSGFTTTGASIIKRGLWKRPKRGKDELPHGLLFWRAITQWLGGMGIIVLGLAILPFLGVGGMQLFKAETPGPIASKLQPRIRETAKILWGIYIFITGIEVLLLMIGGLDPFNAVIHSFTTMATGGFSTMEKSIGAFGNRYIEWIITLFMFLAGVNFSLHYAFLIRKPSSYIRDPEFRFYAGIIFGFILLITVIFQLKGMAFEGSLRQAAFQVISILTTTGYSSVDFEAWIKPAAFFLFVLMFIGGCAGSTGGGIKCIRIWILLKQAYKELYRLEHPHAVYQVKLKGKVVSQEAIQSIQGFVSLYFLFFFLFSIIIAFSGLDFVTVVSSVIACMGNIGPGFGDVGPMDNYAHISGFGKWILSFSMILGRLEIYTVILLFIPEYWRG